MNQFPEAKSARLLVIFSRLTGGETVSKSELAAKYHVSERSIQRDMESLRCFFANQGLPQDIIYDHRLHGYRLIDKHPKGLNNSEILAVCKILLESRSMRQDEMFPIIDKLLDCAVPVEQQQAVKGMIANEMFHYIEPHHQKHILDGLWEVEHAIQSQLVMEIEYERLKEPKSVSRRVLPVGLMLSEFYFYLTAFLEDKSTFENPDDLFPTIYRIDRIKSFRILDEHFKVPYKDRFKEGEFRKRVQFMYGGKLELIRFKYTGPSLEAVLDRLPTARIINEDVDGWTVEAEVFGKGIEMWLRSQGEHIKREGQRV